MKVLHVITTLNRGGAENHLVELARNQVKQGIQVTLAYLKGSGYWATTLQQLGVRVEYLGLTRYGELTPLFRLRSLVRGLAPDIVHAHMPPAELYVRLALLNNPAPIMIVSKHNDEPFFRGPGQSVVGRWVIRRAARIIAISEAVNVYVRRHLHIPSERLTTIHYGIDPRPYGQIQSDRRMALRAEWGVPSDAWVIGTVARLVPQKALHVLLSAYACYRMRALRSARLVLVGRGPLEVELKALTHKLGLAGEVVWAGFREDIPDVMCAFDVFALTSVYEGFGLALLEAMSASRPIIATTVSAIPEIVEDGKTGRLIPPNDPMSVACAFLQLEDDGERARLGKGGYVRVMSHFSVGRMAEATLAAYRESVA